MFLDLPGGQEELAFVFEMLQQFEDALVQYDELDALFSQYVANSGAGGECPRLGSTSLSLRFPRFSIAWQLPFIHHRIQSSSVTAFT